MLSNANEALAKRKKSLEQTKCIQAYIVHQLRHEKELNVSLQQTRDKEHEIEQKFKQEERWQCNKHAVMQLFEGSISALEDDLASAEVEREILNMIELQGHTQLCLLETNSSDGVKIHWNRIVPKEYLPMDRDDFVEGIRGFGTCQHILTRGRFKGWKLYYELSWTNMFFLMFATPKVRLVLSEPRWYNLWNIR